MLLATYESLLECSIEKFKELHVNSSSFNFWDWLHSITGENIMNEMSIYWAKILITLLLYCGSYFSIRSDNWVLRNFFLESTGKTIVQSFVCVYCSLYILTRSCDDLPTVVSVGRLCCNKYWLELSVLETTLLTESIGNNIITDICFTCICHMCLLLLCIIISLSGITYLVAITSIFQKSAISNFNKWISKRGFQWYQ